MDLMATLRGIKVEGNILNRVHCFFLMLNVITLPFSIRLNSLSIVLLTLFSLPALFQKGYLNKLYSNKVALMSVSLFLLALGSLFYSGNWSDGKLIIEKKLSLLILPLVLSAFQYRSEFLKKILMLFVASCLIALATCFVLAIYNNFQYSIKHNLPLTSVNEWFFVYTLFAKNIGIHPTFLALYCSFSLFILLNNILYEASTHKTIKIFAIAILMSGIIILSARIIIGITVLMLLVFLFNYFKKKNKLKIFAIVALLFTVGVTTLTLSNSVSRRRIKDTFMISKTETDTESSFSGFDLRYKMWKTGLVELISDHWLLGVGIGDSQPALQKVYAENGMEVPAEQNYNLHNQYLEFWLDSGIFSLFLFMGILGLSAYKAYIQGHFEYLIFVVIILVSALTDSILEVQKGVVFFSLFISLFTNQVNRKSV